MPALSNPDAAKFTAALMQDLKAAGGRCVVVPGEHASPAIHLAAMQLNQSLGAVGKAVVYGETVNPMPSEQLADFKSLVGDMRAGKVQWLVMLGVNPVYTAPSDANFEALLNSVPVSVHLGMQRDETGSISTWHLNKAHYLESWSDARAYDGTLSIIQPMIAPLYSGVSAHDVLQGLLDNPDASAYDMVSANAKQYIKGDFETGWRKALHDGWIAGTAFAAGTKAPGAGGATGAGAPTAQVPAGNGGLELLFKADQSIYDGRWANVGWLQELPKQVTSLSWDNAALMSLITMEKLGHRGERGDRACGQRPQGDCAGAGGFRAMRMTPLRFTSASAAAMRAAPVRGSGSTPTRCAPATR